MATIVCEYINDTTSRLSFLAAPRSANVLVVATHTCTSSIDDTPPSEAKKLRERLEGGLVDETGAYLLSIQSSKSYDLCVIWY